MSILGKNVEQYKELHSKSKVKIMEVLQLLLLKKLI